MRNERALSAFNYASVTLIVFGALKVKTIYLPEELREGDIIETV